MRAYLAYFSSTLLIFAVLLLGTALWFGTFERLDGDLTRIGFYSERDFGWNTQQPTIELLQHQTQADGADVLVLGDSFSEPNAWQSVVSPRLNKRFASFRYEDNDCFEGFIGLALRHPMATRVVLQTVERNFATRFGEDRSCAVGEALPWREAGARMSTHRESWPPELHIRQTVHGAWNVLKMQARPNAVFKSNIVVNAPLVPGCGTFSSRRADRILYYGVDEDKSLWTQAQQARAVSRLSRLRQALSEQGKTLTMVIVPDKSSVYRDCLPTQEQALLQVPFDVVQTLRMAGIDTVDLLPAFKADARRIVDFYHPNNTHLSERGYIAMAGHLQAHLARPVNR